MAAQPDLYKHLQVTHWLNALVNFLSIQLPWPQVVFDLLCNMDLIPEWDMLYKGAKYLTFARDPSGRCEVGDIHVVYGLPGK